MAAQPDSFFRTVLLESEEAIDECREQILDNAVCYFFLDAQFCDAFEAEFGMSPQEWMATPEARIYMALTDEDSPLRRDYAELQFQAKRKLYNF